MSTGLTRWASKPAAGYGNEAAAGQFGTQAQLARQLVPVDARQADIAQAGIVAGVGSQRLGRRMGHREGTACRAGDKIQPIARVDVVVTTSMRSGTALAASTRGGQRQRKDAAPPRAPDC